ncbi:MAG: 3-dehydroquinate synthase family protein [Flavobacteriales bacterium]
MLQFADNLTDLSRKLDSVLRDSSSIFLLTDENVSEKCLPQLIAACPFLEKAEVIEIESGESSKSVEIVLHLWQHLLDCNADRKSVLINLGGGVVTDLGGFIASTFKRGIRTIHIPTSLLGMVDAAIGAKTGIDFGGIKNAIGTFYPADVLVYPQFAQSLPEQEVTSGFGEVLKTALITDAEFSAQLMKIKKIAIGDLMEFIPTCAFIKEEIVSEDLQESGRRKLLNLGHTIGHALESSWLESGNHKPHGICIALGILAETRIAAQKNLCDGSLVDELDEFVIRVFGLQNTVLPDIRSIQKTIHQDKKNRAGTILMVLLNRLGLASIDIPADFSEIELAWSDLQKRLNG